MMNKLQTVKWENFKIDQLFTAENTGNVLARDVEDGSGETPYVTASGFNNGVVKYIDAGNYKKMKGNCILVGGKTFTITYQALDFVSNDSHNFILTAKEKKVKKNQYLFLVTVIRETYAQKYSWGDAVTKSKMLNESIKLPALDKDTPDWKFMGEYIAARQKEVNRILNILERIIGDRDRN